MESWRNRSADPKTAPGTIPPQRSQSTSSQQQQQQQQQRVNLSGEAFKQRQEREEGHGTTSGPTRKSKIATIESIEVDELSTVIAERGAENQRNTSSGSPLNLAPIDLDVSGEELELDAIVMALSQKEKSRSGDDDYDIPSTTIPVLSSSGKKKQKKPRASPSPPRLTPSGRDLARRRSPRSSPIPHGRTPDSGDVQPPLPRKSSKQPSYSLKESNSKNPNDSLSDIPSNIDNETKERYLMACRLLKSALIEKETRLMPTEKDFLRGLLEESERAYSEAQVSAIETASYTLFSDPLFQMDDITEPNSSFDAAKAAWQQKVEKTRANKLQLNRSSSPISRLSTATPTIENRTPERKKLRSSPNRDKETDMSPKRMPPSRDGDDYLFKILGIKGVRPGVLTPPLMEAIRGFFPYGVAEENFLLKFSLERDGASLPSLLDKVRTSRYTIMSVETKDGTVFGAFCSSPWRVRPSWFGSGESFLWRLKNSRIAPGTNVRNYDFDNEMEVYPYTGNDELIQYCTKRTIAVGGGDWSDGLASPYDDEPAGIGFMVDGDLMGGETNCCATFANPRLCGRSSKSNEFEITNLEVWTVTPCLNEAEAEMLEMRRLFVEENIG